MTGTCLKQTTQTEIRNKESCAIIMAANDPLQRTRRAPTAKNPPSPFTATLLANAFRDSTLVRAYLMILLVS